jgi:hypothetical protein
MHKVSDIIKALEQQHSMIEYEMVKINNRQSPVFKQLAEARNDLLDVIFKLQGC